jgi:hypothetical protein
VHNDDAVAAHDPQGQIAGIVHEESAAALPHRTPGTSLGASSDSARDPALIAVEDDHPPWCAWPGVMGGLVYARRPNSSPPMVVRSASPDGLREAIVKAEEERGLR